jgi:hypothetical protein
MNATPRDMSQLLLLLINRGEVGGKRFLKEGTIRQMEVKQTGLGALGLMQGYSMGIDSEEHNGYRLFSHYGDADGYLAKFAYNNESGRGYFVVINAFNHEALDLFVNSLDGWLVEALPEKKPETAISLNTAELQFFTGRYKRVTYRFDWQREETLRQTIQVSLVTGRLYRRFINSDLARELVPVAKGLFREADEHYRSIAIVKADDSQIYMETPFGGFVRTQ